MKSILTFLCVLTASAAGAQDDLEALLNADEQPEIHYSKYAFKSTRIINGHSIENVSAGVLDFRILHRFGAINGGPYELFGLDQANMRMSFDYGITDRLQVGIGRSNIGKEYDGLVKYKILRQSSGARQMPVSVSWVSGMLINTQRWPDPNRENLFSSRLSYYHQLLIARKFNETFSLQLSPTLVHRNLVPNREIPNDVFAIGMGGRVKLSNRIATTFDYFYVLPGQLPNHRNSLSVGFDIETGGHVFQLHFTNSRGLNERQFITGQNGSWLDGDIHFGFNLSRVFTIRSPKEHR
ncbi:MAG: hypothetical protein C0424_00120 [Sphingobacteriaceae bacterium]|nr:hypothetical protein [Sphingobacteriaceae bacterium]